MRRADQRGQIKRAAAGNHIRNCPGDPTQRSVAPVPSSRNFDQTALIARGRPRPAAAVAIDTKQGARPLATRVALARQAGAAGSGGPLHSQAAIYRGNSCQIQQPQPLLACPCASLGFLV